MEQEPIVSKSKIMRLASDQVNDKSNADRRDGPEKETTLDASSLNLLDELCNASKEGDMEKIESLVRNFGAPINLVDSWQCTPLYYACLCGHYEVVKFLLENGAQCDPNTFTGERCLYGALNDKIRDLLRSYKFSKAVNENQPYLQFLTDMYNNHPYDDLTFLIRSKRGADDDSLFEEFPVQRFVLAARSSYFRQQLLERWRNEPLVTLSSKLVDASAFKAVLGYLYTGQLLDTKKDILENIVFVCKHLELPELQARCEHILSTGGNADKNANRAQDAKEMAKIRSDYERFLGTLLQNAMHIKRDGHGSATATWPWQQERQERVSMAATFADIGIVVDNIMFPCHRACLCRSEYFKIMLQGNFSESDLDSSTVRIGDEQVQLPLVDLHDVAPETFSYVLEFLYTDRCTIPAKEAYDVLLVADMLFLDRLKSIASIAITNQEKPVMDIYDLIRTAIELNVDRLEQWCTRYFAEHLDDFINEPEFLELIRESAQSITGRQETDSIPFIDDLRYYLGKIYCIFDDDIDNMNMEGRGEEEYRDTLTELEAMYSQKLELLDRALESIGLEA